MNGRPAAAVSALTAFGGFLQKTVLPSEQDRPDIAGARANPAKVEDYCGKDLLQLIGLARFPFDKLIPACREAR
jgi:hypothetical protein